MLWPGEVRVRSKHYDFCVGLKGNWEEELYSQEGVEHSHGN